jgi:N-acetylglutamate synthase
MNIAELTIDRHEEVLALFKRTPGISVREGDSREATVRYLARNPGLSFIAEEGKKIIGCAMCGHDGRRGYLQHVVVDPTFRGKRIAHDLITRCLDRLADAGIVKVHIDVLVTNDLANEYWTKKGWSRRDDIYRYSFLRSTDTNA